MDFMDIIVKVDDIREENKKAFHLSTFNEEEIDRYLQNLQSNGDPLYDGDGGLILEQDEEDSDSADELDEKYLKQGQRRD